VKLMREFWFDGDAQFAPIGTLSGGERRRLQLLLTLIEQPNLLLLDEPTNDLDLDTLRALEAYLDDWPGIVVVVSHDRVFLDRTVTEVVALDRQGRAVVVRGGVAGWLAQHAAGPTTAPASQPKKTAAPKPKVSTKSPSTLRRQLGVADRELAAAITERDAVQVELSDANVDHTQRHTQWEALAAKLAAAQQRVDTAEERWLSLADEAESLRMEF
jgi:ABC transport system ATP-binding/permease protein